MDTVLVGSLIGAIATVLSIIFAVIMANRQIRSSAKLLQIELGTLRVQSKLNTYENLVNSERQMFSIMLQDEKNSKSLLGHFMKDGFAVPEDTSEVRMLIASSCRKIQN